MKRKSYRTMPAECRYMIKGYLCGKLGLNQDKTVPSPNPEALKLLKFAEFCLVKYLFYQISLLFKREFSWFKHVYS